MKKLLRFYLMLVWLVSLFVLIFPLTAQESAVFPTDGWQTSMPEAQGIDSQMLANLLNANLDAHTILVIRHGSVVMDATRYPFSSTEPHAMFSATKSFVSTLVGIAIDQGYIESVDQSIWDFFPADQTANMDERKQAITIADLLTQRSGLDIGDDRAMYTLTAANESWVQHILDNPMNANPGTSFIYTNGNAHLVSALIGIATGMSAAEYAQQVLFAPLGITDANWIADPQGVNTGGDQLFMSPRSMAKLGYLFLHQGQWDGQQIVSSEWVTAATSPHVPNANPANPWSDYAYLWWHDPELPGIGSPGFAALGYMGQQIMVVPELDMVIVTTNDTSVFTGAQLVAGGVINAASSVEALPDNPEALAQLQARLDALANPQPGNLAAIPEALVAIAGNRYTLTETSAGWRTFMLDLTDASEPAIIIGFDDRDVRLPFGLDGIYRISSTGFPPEPLWRPVDNIPVLLKATALGNSLRLNLDMLLGTEIAEITLRLNANPDEIVLNVVSSVIADTLYITGTLE